MQTSVICCQAARVSWDGHVHMFVFASGGDEGEDLIQGLENPTFCWVAHIAALSRASLREGPRGKHSYLPRLCMKACVRAR